MRMTPLVLTITALAVPLRAVAQTSSARSSPVIENYFQSSCPTGSPAIGVDSNDQKLYVWCGAPSAISVFDTAGHFISETPLSAASATGQTAGLAVDSTGRRLFLVSREQVTIVDASTLDEIESILLPGAHDFGVSMVDVGTDAVVFDPVHKRLYLGGSTVDASVVWEIDPSRPSDDPARVTQLAVPSANNYPVDALVIDETARLLIVSSEREKFIVDMDETHATYFQIIGLLDADSYQSSTGFDASQGVGSAGIDCRGNGDGVGPQAITVSSRRHRIYCTTWFSAPPNGWLTGMLSVIDVDPASPTFKQTNVSTPVAPPMTDQNGMNYTARADVLRDLVYVVVSGTYTTGLPPQLVAYDANTLAVLAESSVPQQLPAAYGYTSYLEEGGYKTLLDPVSHHLYLYNRNKVIIIRDAPSSELAVAEDAEVGPVTISSPQVTISFADVSTGGTITVAPIQPEDLNLALSGQFSLSGAGAYEISTTASVSPPTRCASMPRTSPIPPRSACSSCCTERTERGSIARCRGTSRPERFAPRPSRSAPSQSAGVSRCTTAFGRSMTNQRPLAPAAQSRSSCRCWMLLV